jgi:hypothetical protein
LEAFSVTEQCWSSRPAAENHSKHRDHGYLVNQLEKDFGEAQDHGYEFHFSWLLILIAFTTWEMSKGATFPKN